MIAAIHLARSIGRGHHLPAAGHHCAAIRSDALLADQLVVRRPAVPVAGVELAAAHATVDAGVVEEAKVLGANHQVGGADGALAAGADGLHAHVVGLADEVAPVGVQRLAVRRGRVPAHGTGEAGGVPVAIITHRDGPLQDHLVALAAVHLTRRRGVHRLRRMVPLLLLLLLLLVVGVVRVVVMWMLVVMVVTGVHRRRRPTVVMVSVR